MNKPTISILLLLLLSIHGFAGDIYRELLTLDKLNRADSILVWYKKNLRERDSAYVFNELNKFQNAAEEENSAFGIAEVLFLKGQHIAVKLSRIDEGADYMQQAIAIAKKENLEFEWAEYLHNLGVLYFAADRVPAAIECFIRAHEKFEELGYAKNKAAGKHLYNTAYVYYHLKNYKECLKYLLPALKYPKYDHWIAQQIENTIGLAYFELGSYDSAAYYFDRTLNIATTNKDTVWIGIVCGNLGEVYMKRGEQDKAMDYFSRAYELCRGKYMGASGNAIGALIAMAKINTAKGDVNEAMGQLQEASAWLLDTAQAVDYWRRADLYESLAAVYALKNDHAKAYKYLHEATEVRDSMARKENALRYINVQQQLESEKHLAKVNLLESEKQQEQIKQYYLLAALLLLIIVGWQVYNRYRLRTKKNIEIKDKQAALLALEKKHAEEELQNAQQLLNQYIKSIQEKNELIENFSKEIAALPEQDNVEKALQYDNIEKLAEATLLTEKDWNEFQELFLKVHKGFFVKLKEKAPDLTEAEVRLMALIKLNLSNRHMARMLGISPASVHTARYRLRKKMGLPEESPLEELAGQI
jgi:tetratricopeptide (TPR) repeat protein